MGAVRCRLHVQFGHTRGGLAACGLAMRLLEEALTALECADLGEASCTLERAALAVLHAGATDEVRGSMQDGGHIVAGSGPACSEAAPVAKLAPQHALPIREVPRGAANHALLAGGHALTGDKLLPRGQRHQRSTPAGLRQACVAGLPLARTALGVSGLHVAWPALQHAGATRGGASAMAEVSGVVHLWRFRAGRGHAGLRAPPAIHAEEVA
mmetsp:Transcript_97712/g.296680  ORF Transcript_97712/g.296680 Transcript_97712/m.296680 type:complete len:212 (-) Transcript_97712:9-644(-)